jgi:predicted PurR-regulated permease PerM
VVVLTITTVGAIAVAALSWARVVFIPVALAIFLSFMLEPLVRRLQNRGVGRIPSVLGVVFLAAVLLTGVGWIVGIQVKGLVARLPDYESNIRARVQTVRSLSTGWLPPRVQEMFADIAGELRVGQGEEVPGERVGPRTVVVQSAPSTWSGRLLPYLGSTLEWAGGLILVLVLLIFILLEREKTRTRLLALFGQGRLAFATRALHDVNERITRYLIVQAIVNSTFGVAVAAGLFFLGVEYALLWGFLTALLRYIPYLGPWIAAAFPLTLSLAMSDNWWQPWGVVGLFLLLEPFTGNFVEPRVYGHSIGVSEIGLLVSAAFWTFLWGPVGLVLSAPLTVCLVALGRYVPSLRFVEVLLGDNPGLPAWARFYQRLLARDKEEARVLLAQTLRTALPEQALDDLLLPALHQVQRDRQRGDVTEADEARVLEIIRDLLPDVRDKVLEARASVHAPPTRQGRVLACPAHDEADELTVEMLRALLDGGRWKVDVLSADALAPEVAEQAEEDRAGLLFIGSVSPRGLPHCRYLCKRLRERFPARKIVVGRWGQSGDEEEQLCADGADEVVTSLADAQSALRGLLPIVETVQAKVS